MRTLITIPHAISFVAGLVACIQGGSSKGSPSSPGKAINKNVATLSESLVFPHLIDMLLTLLKMLQIVEIGCYYVHCVIVIYSFFKFPCFALLYCFLCVH